MKFEFHSMHVTNIEGRYIAGKCVLKRVGEHKIIYIRYNIIIQYYFIL